MEIVPVYVGLDYHRETIRVCVMDVEGETLHRPGHGGHRQRVLDKIRNPLL